MSFLQVENLNVAYGDRPVLQGLNIDLAAGELGCLLGPSGCGKTTLLRAIAGFEPVRAGRITLDGRTLSDTQTHIATERRRVGMVFQDFALFPHLNVADNIGFGLTSKSETSRQRINELLELVRMEGLAGRYPHQLSGGQQQRVALARALAPKPRLLLLDEPFAALDVNSRRQIARQVREILQLENITSLMVTHDQKEAFTMADRIGLIDEGGLLQYATAETLYRRPASRRVAEFLNHGANWIVAHSDNDGQLSTVLGPLDTLADAKSQGSVMLRADDLHIDSDGEPNAIVEHCHFGRGRYTLRLKLADVILGCRSDKPFDAGDEVCVAISNSTPLYFEDQS